MAKWYTSFFSFSRAQRLGILMLSVLLLALLVIRFTMYTWMHPMLGGQTEERLQRAWQQYARQGATTAEIKWQEHRDAGVLHMLPEVIDLNSADSLTLVSMKGIGPATAHNIMVRRQTKGGFTAVKQLRELGAFSDSTFAVLSRHLRVSGRE